MRFHLFVCLQTNSKRPAEVHNKANSMYNVKLACLTLIESFSYIFHTPLIFPIFLQSKTEVTELALVHHDSICDDSEQGGKDQTCQMVMF